jgi:hypothetical protein
LKAKKKKKRKGKKLTRCCSLGAGEMVLLGNFKVKAKAREVTQATGIQ